MKHSKSPIATGFSSGHKEFSNKCTFCLDEMLPKGTILQEVGALLERRQYRIKSLNLINFKKSMKYNPLAYIRSEKDILKLVNALILNTKGEGEKSSEDFWVSATRSQAVKSLRTGNGFPLFGELIV